MVLKGCARCQGDMFLEDDGMTKERVCLQCGYRRAVGVDPNEARISAFPVRSRSRRSERIAA